MVASLRRSGINGNGLVNSLGYRIVMASLLFGEVELMETILVHPPSLVEPYKSLLFGEVELMETLHKLGK